MLPSRVFTLGCVNGYDAETLSKSNYYLMSLKKKAAKATMWSMFESFGVKGITFASGIFLARILDPEDFGLIAMLYVFIELSHSLANGGFQIALVQKKDLSALDVNSVFFFNLGVGAALSFVLYFSASAIAAFFEQPQLYDIVQVMAIIPVLSALNIVQHAMATKELNMKKLARSTIISNLVSVGVCIYMALEGYGVWSLVTQQIVAVLFLFLALWYKSAWYPKAQFSFNSIKQMFDFSSKVLTADFIGQLFKNIYYVVIGKLFSAEQLGFYARGDNLQKFVSETLARTVGRVTFPVLANVQDDMKRMKHILQRSTCLASFVAFPAMLGLASIAEELIPFLLSEKWAPSIPFFQLLCIYGAFNPLHLVNHSGLKALGLGGLFLKLEILKKLLIIIGLAVTFKFGLMAIVYGQVVVCALTYLLNVYYNNKLFGYSIGEQFKDISPFVFSAIIMAICITWVGTVLSASVLTIMLAKMLIGILVYVSCLVALRNSILRESFDLIKSAVEK